MPPADSVARTQTQLPVRFRRHVALGSRPAPNAIQPGTPSSEQPGHAGLRNRSRSSAGHLPTTHRRRSRTQASATRHVGRPSLSVEMLPHVRREAARRTSTSGFSAERVGPSHAQASATTCATTCACGRRCLCATTGSAWLRRSLRPGGVPKQSRHPALLDLGALLLRQHRGAPAAAVKKGCDCGLGAKK